ncbi:MAG: hypothetical protein CK425_02205 [Parachlamydia sp.]|nr:MAG: hypothetical protein CK425_02205 [Parachlamydia sp.]
MIHPDISAVSPQSFFSQPVTPPQIDSRDETNEKVQAQQNRISSLQSDDVLAFQREINAISIQDALDEIDWLSPVGINNLVVTPLPQFSALRQRHRSLALEAQVLSS